MHVRLYQYTNAVELFAKNLPNFSFWFLLHRQLKHQIHQLIENLAR